VVVPKQSQKSSVTTLLYEGGEVRAERSRLLNIALKRFMIGGFSFPEQLLFAVSVFQSAMGFAVLVVVFAFLVAEVVEVRL
jgi:hypothetical protein